MVGMPDRYGGSRGAEFKIPIFAFCDFFQEKKKKKPHSIELAELQPVQRFSSSSIKFKMHGFLN